MKTKLSFIGISIVISVIVLIISYYRVSSVQSVLHDYNNTLYDLQNELAIKQSTQITNDNVVLQNTTGVDVERVNVDVDILTTFAKTVLTWSSSDEYENIRSKMINNYNMSEDSTFMTVFLPADVKFINPDGSVLSYIDVLGRNCTYENIDVEITKIHTGIYSYFVQCTWSSADANGSEGIGTAVFTCDVDINGDISNVEGYIIAE